MNRDRDRNLERLRDGLLELFKKLHRNYILELEEERPGDKTVWVIACGMVLADCIMLVRVALEVDGTLHHLDDVIGGASDAAKDEIDRYQEIKKRWS